MEAPKRAEREEPAMDVAWRKNGAAWRQALASPVERLSDKPKLAGSDEARASNSAGAPPSLAS